MFVLLAENIATRVADSERRRAYGRTLFGVGRTVALGDWVAENKERIVGCEDDDKLFDLVWPCISAQIENATFERWRPSRTRELFARAWIAGESFGELQARMLQVEVRIGLGSRPRKPKVEHLVEMGENALGFDGAHVLGAITELFELLSPDEEDAVAVLQTLQKRLKYGLPSGPSILLYEAGFADRPLAIDLAAVVPKIASRAQLRLALRKRREVVEEVIRSYPQYFRNVLERVAG
ncbi:MAG: hypothetical protein H7A47_00990 [Verrucomicrobiales bacterium]|nr:hypothetical protein [Verrucomicrobiales bacterium]